MVTSHNATNNKKSKIDYFDVRDLDPFPLERVRCRLFKWTWWINLLCDARNSTRRFSESIATHPTERPCLRDWFCVGVSVRGSLRKLWGTPSLINIWQHFYYNLFEVTPFPHQRQCNGETNIFPMIINAFNHSVCFQVSFFFGGKTSTLYNQFAFFLNRGWLKKPNIVLCIGPCVTATPTNFWTNGRFFR